MKLVHYTNVEFLLEPNTYDQSEATWQAKPRGLWVSIEGKYDWRSWCESEGFQLENLVISYEIKLKEEANILNIQTAEEVFNLAQEYPYSREQWNDCRGRELYQSYELDWHKVKSRYQGIIIAPYQWRCRLSPKSIWYYGWDCVSGCIWDLTCIEEFKLRETNEVNRSYSCVG